MKGDRMRSKWLWPAAALATAMVAAPAAAQSIAYINFLQFGLQSYRSQATGGIFVDDIDNFGNPTRLLDIEGSRLFTNFSNLADPATLGDNVLTYSLDHSSDFLTNGITSTPSPDTFDSGSYLGGWTGLLSDDSAFRFSLVYQRNGDKVMYENLEDGLISGGVTGSQDAEFDGTVVTTFDNGDDIGDGTNPTEDGDGEIDADETLTSDMKRYDDRSATNFDFGVSTDASDELAIGGRIFYMQDSVDRFREGTARFSERTRQGLGGAMLETDYTTVEFEGLGEDAFKARDIGVSLNADFHPSGSEWSLNARLDVASTNLTNPSSGLGLPTRGLSGWWENIVGNDVNWGYVVDASVVDDGTVFGAGNSEGTLTGVHAETQFFTGSGFTRGAGSSAVIESVDDERTGIGFNGLLEFDYPWAGGETRTHVGFGYRPYEVDATIVQRNILGETFWWNDGTSGDVEATSTDIDQTVTTTRDGDMNFSVMEAGAKWRRELSNNVSVGLGLIATRTKSSDDYEQTVLSRTIEDKFDDGAAGVNVLDTFAGGGFNEEETIIESSTVTNVEDETVVNTFRFPVGSVFNITRKIKANLGVTNTVSKWSRETTGTRAEGDDGRTVTTLNDFGDPSNNDVEYFEDGVENFDTTTTDRSEDHTTTYWYGLEFLIGTSAQINVNGFFDTHADRSESPQFDNSSGQLFDVDFFRNLAMSITFIFD